MRKQTYYILMTSEFPWRAPHPARLFFAQSKAPPFLPRYSPRTAALSLAQRPLRTLTLWVQ